MWGRHATELLVLLGFVLIGATGGKGHINRIIRHPQLTGVALWAIGHLLANGDMRSPVLFGGLGLRAVTSTFLLNRRDGIWK